ncbi:hypothetical protein SAY87_016910 [Trapa incisa]|uniref:RING-type E3 ubiquitin transferase n=1 Tax=Trapa incisa TaxID=236973 RepID=A0AAN7LA41_9MYRT|nr:hypothetical protein SAY87_016910 [Trapa incisa]
MPSSPPPLTSNGGFEAPPAPSSSGSKISPAILLVIIVLAVVFFLLGLIHLFMRYLVRRRSPPDSEVNRHDDEVSGGSEAFQRQLQQLFHLHDSGLDQAFIDALPVFLYKEIMGLKEPFDCAVCLCEFSDKDKLRLLPLCSHAFHIDCIDSWLLSNSTCPLCRGSLYSNSFAFENPIVDLGDWDEGEDAVGVSMNGVGGNGLSSIQKPGENSILNQKRVFSVRLGKFRSSNLNQIERGTVGGGGGRGGGGETSCSSSISASNLDARRCISMGSYEYVVSDLELQIALHPKGATCNGGGSMRKLKSKEEQIGKSVVQGDAEGKRISIASKGDSFSVSKIWLWSKNKTPTAFPDSSGVRRGNDLSVHMGFPLKDRTQNQIT